MPWRSERLCIVDRHLPPHARLVVEPCMASSVPSSVIDLSSDLVAVSALRPYTGIADHFGVFKQRIDGTVSVAAAPIWEISF